MPIESAREIDLHPRKTVGLELPIKNNKTSDFALTKNAIALKAIKEMIVG